MNLNGTASRQRGMTLVEIMVSLAIGVIVVGAAIQVLVGSKQNYRMIESMSRIQEDARYIMDMMAVDIRMTGTRICGETNGTANMLTGAAGGNEYDIFNTVLQGFENGAGASGMPGSGVGSLVANTDVLRIKNVDTQSQYFITAHDTASSKMTLSAAPDFTPGEIAIACDPDFSAAFQVTSLAGTNDIHHAAGGVTPGNTASGFGYEFPPIAQVFKANTIQYYIGVGSDGATPALYRAALEVSGGALGFNERELIPGVENLQISFGEDTNGDGVVDAYRAGGSVASWDAVLSVRINLVFRSQDDNVVDASQSYVFEGNTITPTDRYLRRVFSSTIGIRNRLSE